MRYFHLISAFIIAMIANSIESVWLGLVTLLILLAAYARFAIWMHKRSR
jgi:hypothetical protein